MPSEGSGADDPTQPANAALEERLDLLERAVQVLAQLNLGTDAQAALAETLQKILRELYLARQARRVKSRYISGDSRRP